MILYLGLDPSRYPSIKPILHYPVICTKKLMTPELLHAKTLWHQFTHVIFTSQTAVEFWSSEVTFSEKVVIAVGKATGYLLESRGISPLIAREETQEGVMALLEKLDLQGSYIFWPKSRLARPVLERFFVQNQVRYFALDLYDTITQKLEPVPNLSGVDEIVFTSPSTVRGFIEIYGSLPIDKKLTAIGPVTQGEISALLRA
jgi:uroporphyrinogen-III synthase